MKLLLIVDDYLPHSIKVAAKMMHELAIEFKNKGHQVTVLCPLPKSNKLLKTGFIDGVQVLYFKSGEIKNISKLKRAINESLLSKYAWKATKSYFTAHPQDGIIYYSPTIFFGQLVTKLKKLWKCPSYLILRDIFPQWAIDNGLIKKKSLIHRYFDYFEQINYKAANTIGVMSPSNLKYFNSRFSTVDKFEVLYNWASSTESASPSNTYRSKLNIQDKIIFFYGGNIGYAQQMMNLIELAKRLKTILKVHFVFVGKGDEVGLLLEQKEKHQLTNITYLPPVNQDDYFKMLNEFDVGLFSLHKDHKTHNFPGKLLGYMDYEKPILGCTNYGNDLKAIINTNDAGFVVESGDHNSMEIKALKLIENAELRHLIGKKGKVLLNDLFSTQTATSKIEKALNVNSFPEKIR